MVEKLSLPTNVEKAAAENYFNESPNRKSALSDISRLEAKWRNIREYRNEYRDSSVKLFDCNDVPISLDLHGFSANSTKVVLAEFKGFASKYKLNKFHIIYGNGEVLGPLVNEFAAKELAPFFYIYDNIGHTEFEAKNENSIWSPLIIKKSAPSNYQSQYTRSEPASSSKNNVISRVDNAAWHRSPESSKSSYSSQSQSPKTASGGGFFAAIGGFFKGIAEGISEAAEAARRERERIARQQEKYDALYESNRGPISKGYSTIKEMYCTIHVRVFFALFWLTLIAAPLWFFNLILDIEVLNNVFSFIHRWFAVGMHAVANYWFYIVGFYGATLISGSIIESHEEKKFYSMVPKELHHEVKFRFF